MTYSEQLALSMLGLTCILILEIDKYTDFIRYLINLL
jgi:hypothetical protein